MIRLLVISLVSYNVLSLLFVIMAETNKLRYFIVFLQ